MKRCALIFTWMTASASSAVQTVTPETPALIPMEKGEGASLQSMMMINPTFRALDLQQAFEMLRKEKTTGKVYFQLADGSTISNVIDMILMNNSSLILFRYNSNQGVRLQTVKVEDILHIAY